MQEDHCGQTSCSRCNLIFWGLNEYLKIEKRKIQIKNINDSTNLFNKRKSKNKNFKRY